MNKIYYIASVLISCFSLINNVNASNVEGSASIPWWSHSYERVLLEKVGEKLPKLVSFPYFQYPNEGHQEITSRFPDGKVLIYGYGSLMNKISAARSMKPAAVASMQPAIAFGVKRIFNYKVTDPSRWGLDQNRKERAMLNLATNTNIASIANGVILEVDVEDLSNLVSREVGYDLIPILVATWDDVVSQNPHLEIHVAYTFVAVNELRNNISYTSTEFYPVLGYLHAVQEASQTYGPEFAAFWNATTYLANGTTKIDDWDEVTFMGILCTQKP